MLSDNDKRALKAKLDIIKRQQIELYNSTKLHFERGLLEATEERFADVYKEIEKVLKAKGIEFTCARKLESDMQFDPNTNYPYMNFGGQLVNVAFRIHPLDNSQRDKISPEVEEKIKVLIQKEMEIEKKLKEGIQ